MARLTSNIPVLKSGYPPILIPLEKRKDYIEALIQYQLEAGLPAADKEFIQHGESLSEFKAFCFENWKHSLNLVDRAHQRQAERNETAPRAHGVDRDSDKYR
jgi:hypothetical protein